MPVSETFMKLLDQMKAIHVKKSDDYAAKDPYDNFERAAVIASWFDDPIDKVFATMIGIKLARLAVLKNAKREPNNESVADSHLDETVYSAIWAAYERDHPVKSDTLLTTVIDIERQHLNRMAEDNKLFR